MELRQRKIDSVENDHMKNIMKQLYREKDGGLTGEIIGDGSAMDALRNEIKTGKPTNGTFHHIKMEDQKNALEKLIKGEKVVKVNSLTKKKIKKDEWYNVKLGSNDLNVAKKLLNEINGIFNLRP